MKPGRFHPAMPASAGTSGVSCATCGHLSCICEIRRLHKPECLFRIAATGPVGIECKHGRDCCSICDPCTCASLQRDVSGYRAGWDGQKRGADQRAVSEWFSSAGGKATFQDAVKRAGMEFGELVAAADSGDIEHAREEMADVTLALLMAAEIAGFDLLTAVRWKQDINNKRKWRVDENGCLHHVKGSDPRDVKALDTASLSQDSARAKS